MPAPQPAPATTLVVLLGASEYPHDPELSKEQFRNSAEAVRRYFEDPHGFALPADNLLYLFDSPEAPSRQGQKVREFLHEAGSRTPSGRALDVIVYYIGHGCFNGKQKYLLSLRDSDRDAFDTMYHFEALHETIRKGARNARKYFILDSCFSAAALGEMMGGDAAVTLIKEEVLEGAKDDEKGKGTALLCAASSQSTASAPEDEQYTMFSGAFLEALQSGEYGQTKLSMRQCRDRAYDIIKTRFPAKAVRPQVHSPEQSDGDIAGMELFPICTRASGAHQASRVAEGFVDAFDAAALATDSLIRCVVVSPEAEPGDQPPLCEHVRLAWEHYEPEITAAILNYRLTYLRSEADRRRTDARQYTLAELDVSRAFESEESLTRAVEALCKAEVAVFDLTALEPGVLFLLGVRSVARRGVTVCSVGGGYTTGGALPVPFNLQLLNLSVHSKEQAKKGPGRKPYDLIGHKIRTGFVDLANLPHYLDLPAYDAVRQLGVESSAYKPIRYHEKVLVLCPFSQAYTERNWELLVDELPGKIRHRLLESGAPADAAPQLERLLDLDTPRLVAQTLFESIRLTDMCIVDWTNLRPNVMFEAGVRLATNPLGAVDIVEEKQGVLQIPQDVPRHVEAMTRLFNPIAYRCGAGAPAPYYQMIARFEARLAASHKGEAGFAYRALGRALDRVTHPTALPLVDELIRSANILQSDDQESTGISPVLYHEVNKDLVAEAKQAAAERRLAAWLFMERRYTPEQIASDSQRCGQFHLLSAQTRRWARQERRLDLVAGIKSTLKAVRTAESAARPAVLNAEAESAWLSARVKACKEEAKDYRDEGDMEAAIEVLQDAVKTLEASPVCPRLGAGSTPTSEQKTVASHLADCLGMIGGNYRRLSRFDEAVKYFERGSQYEQDERFGINSSYNLVNATTLPLEMGTHTATDQRSALEQAIKALDRQVKGERRRDRWAWADLGQCQLLLGDVESARSSYEQMRALGDDETGKSVLDVLHRLLSTLESVDPPIAAALRRGIAMVES